MRFLGKTKHISFVEGLSKVLRDKGILFTAESEENLDWGSDEFGTIEWKFWIHDEKDVPLAKLLWLQMLNSPSQSKCKETTPITLPPQNEAPTSPNKGRRQWLPPLCTLFLSLCVLFFVLDSLLQWKNQSVSSPLRKEFLFDYPKALEIAEAHPEKADRTPFFPGFLPIMEYCHGNLKDAWAIGSSLPMFERIRQGEIWRSITPIFLHHDIFHILFNMFWLILLGPALERYLKFFPFLLLTITAACLSNTAQYLVSGFSFLGFSGVIAAYGGYIYTDIRKNPSSPFFHFYEQSRFLLWMILFFALLSVVEILLSMFFSIRLPFSFANTAHLTGFGCGALYFRINNLRHSQG